MTVRGSRLGRRCFPVVSLALGAALLLAVPAPAAAQKSAALPATFGALAKARGCGFLDANKYIESSPTDGIHFEREAHAALALAVADAIRAL